MKRIIRLIEVNSVEEVNSLLSDNKFFLYDRLINNGIITFFVAEITPVDIQACESDQSILRESGLSQSDVSDRHNQQSNRQ